MNLVNVNFTGYFAFDDIRPACTYTNDFLTSLLSSFFILSIYYYKSNTQESSYIFTA